MNFFGQCLVVFAKMWAAKFSTSIVFYGFERFNSFLLSHCWSRLQQIATLVVFCYQVFLYFFLFYYYFVAEIYLAAAINASDKVPPRFSSPSFLYNLYPSAMTFNL